MFATILLLAQAAFAADTYVIDGNGGNPTHECSAGQAVSVTGSNNHVTLTGNCGKLTVSGSNDEITVDGVSSIQVTGTNNDVTWSRNLSGKKKLPVTVTGIGNSVHRS